MHPITNLLLLTSLLTHHPSAFQIPQNTTQDVFYAITLSPSGAEIHTPFSPELLPLPQPPKPHNNKKRHTAEWPPRAKTYCGDSYIDASDFTEKASLDFRKRCDRTNLEFLKGAMAVYSLHGTAVAYMCNFSDKGNPCSSAEFADSVRKIGETCLWSQGGVLQTGEVIMHGWKKGYGFTSNLDRYICESKDGRWGWDS